MTKNYELIYKLSKRTRNIVSRGIGNISNYNFFLNKIETIFKPSNLENWITEETKFMDPLSIINFRRNLICKGLINKPHEPKGFFLRYSQIKDVTRKHHNFFSIFFSKSLFLELRILLQSINPRYQKKIKSRYLNLLKEVNELPNMHNVAERIFKGDNSIGNPHKIYIKKNKFFITESFLRHSEYLIKVIKSINLQNINKVLEISPGYGGFTEILINSISNIEEVFLIDFPQRLNLAGFYLSESINQEWRFKYYKKINPVETDLKQRRDGKYVNLISIEDSLNFFNNNKDKIDLIINTHSLQEMSNEQISFYAKNINLIKPKNFISINRDKLIKDKVSKPNQILVNELSEGYSCKSLVVDKYFTLTQFTKK